MKQKDISELIVTFLAVGLCLLCLWVATGCTIPVKDDAKPVTPKDCTYTVITPGPVYQCKTLDTFYRCGAFLKDCWTELVPGDKIKGSEIQCATNVIMECK